MKWTWHIHSNSDWVENEYICNMIDQLSYIYQNTPEHYQRVLLSILTEIRSTKKYSENVYKIFLRLLKIMKDIFENAKFGDKFKDIEGKLYIYHYAEEHNSGDKIWIYHYLMREPETLYNGRTYADYKSYVNIDGYGVASYLKYSGTLDSLMNSTIKGSIINEKVI